MVKTYYLIGYLLVNIELNVVRTPVVWLRADLVILPATGIDPINELKILQKPNAIISCDASTTFPPPTKKKKKVKLFLYNY